MRQAARKVRESLPDNVDDLKNIIMSKNMALRVISTLTRDDDDIEIQFVNLIAEKALGNNG